MAESLIQKIDSLLSKCELATPGPWINSNWTIMVRKPTLPHYEIAECYMGDDDDSGPRPQQGLDADFIASARIGYPAALKALKAALSFMDKLRNDMGDDSLLGLLTRQAVIEIEKELG